MSISAGRKTEVMELLRRSLYLSTVDPNAGDLARTYGFGLELAEFCTAWNLDDEFASTDRKVRQELRGISRATLHAPYNELFPCAIDRKARALAAERYLQTVEVAALYGIKKIVVHGAYDPHLYFPEWFIPQSAAFFRELVPKLPEDVTLCLENVLEPEPDMLADIVRQVDDPRIRMCLDVGHAQAYSHAQPMQWLEQCQDVLAHFHVHNNDGSQDLHGSLSQGVIPMTRLLKKIQALCPDATVTLEIPDVRSSIIWLQEQDLLEETK